MVSKWENCTLKLRHTYSIIDEKYSTECRIVHRYFDMKKNFFEICLLEQKWFDKRTFVSKDENGLIKGQSMTLHAFFVGLKLTLFKSIVLGVWLVPTEQEIWSEKWVVPNPLIQSFKMLNNQKSWRPEPVKSTNVSRIS